VGGAVACSEDGGIYYLSSGKQAGMWRAIHAIVMNIEASVERDRLIAEIQGLEVVRDYEHVPQSSQLRE
jgi:hypothetical protein